MLYSCLPSFFTGRIVHSKSPSQHSGSSIDGRLKPGDRILRIGNISVERATKDEAFTMIMETQSVVQFTVYRAGHHQQCQYGEEQANRPTGERERKRESSGGAGPAMMPGPRKERNCACQRCARILATPT